MGHFPPAHSGRSARVPVGDGAGLRRRCDGRCGRCAGGGRSRGRWCWAGQRCCRCGRWRGRGRASQRLAPDGEERIVVTPRQPQAQQLVAIERVPVIWPYLAPIGRIVGGDGDVGPAAGFWRAIVHAIRPFQDEGLARQGIALAGRGSARRHCDRRRVRGSPPWRRPGPLRDVIPVAVDSQKDSIQLIAPRRIGLELHVQPIRARASQKGTPATVGVRVAEGWLVAVTWACSPGGAGLRRPALSARGNRLARPLVRRAQESVVQGYGRRASASTRS